MLDSIVTFIFLGRRPVTTSILEKTVRTRSHFLVVLTKHVLELPCCYSQCTSLPLPRNWNPMGPIPHFVSFLFILLFSKYRFTFFKLILAWMQFDEFLLLDAGRRRKWKFNLFSSFNYFQAIPKNALHERRLVNNYIEYDTKPYAGREWKEWKRNQYDNAFDSN